MDMPDPVTTILFNKPQSNVWTIEPDDVVFNAIQLMADKNVGALPVMNGDTLVGIVSERDYTRKVILKGRSSKNTPVSDIMSSPVICIPPDTDVKVAMQLMGQQRIRHLPVVENHKVVGIISIGDLVQRTLSVQGALIDQLENYCHGTYPA